jgi:type VI protein secretion system component VasK
LFTTPPDPDLLVSEHNEPYIKGLRGLGENLDRLAQAPTADQPGAIAQAQAALVQAKQAHAGLADKFADAEGLNKQLSDLLYQPIKWADLVIPKPAKPGAKKDGELAAFCKEMRPTLMKYPFKADGRDAELDDLKRGFAPNVGLVSKYVQGSGAELVVRSESGQEWKPNPALKDVKVAPELVAFLTRTQQVTNAFFGEGRATPQLTYTLRRGQEPMIGFQLMLDGKPLDSQDAVRRTFLWPAQGADIGGKGIVMVGGVRAGGFGSFPGLWGVFKLFQIADERPLGNRKVQWSKNRGIGGGEAQILDPPAKVEFNDFPGGVDVFNPKFFEALQQCPKRAVVPE